MRSTSRLRRGLIWNPITPDHNTVRSCCNLGRRSADIGPTSAGNLAEISPGSLGGEMCKTIGHCAHFGSEFRPAIGRRGQHWPNSCQTWTIFLEFGEHWASIGRIRAGWDTLRHLAYVLHMSPPASNLNFRRFALYQEVKFPSSGALPRARRELGVAMRLSKNNITAEAIGGAFRHLCSEAVQARAEGVRELNERRADLGRAVEVRPLPQRWKPCLRLGRVPTGRPADLSVGRPPLRPIARTTRSPSPPPARPARPPARPRHPQASIGHAGKLR